MSRLFYHEHVVQVGESICDIAQRHYLYDNPGPIVFFPMNSFIKYRLSTEKEIRGAIDGVMRPGIKMFVPWNEATLQGYINVAKALEEDYNKNMKETLDWWAVTEREIKEYKTLINNIGVILSVQALLANGVINFSRSGAFAEKIWTHFAWNGVTVFSLLQSSPLDPTWWTPKMAYLGELVGLTNLDIKSWEKIDIETRGNIRRWTDQGVAALHKNVEDACLQMSANYYSDTRAYFYCSLNSCRCSGF